MVKAKANLHAHSSFQWSVTCRLAFAFFFVWQESETQPAGLWWWWQIIGNHHCCKHAGCLLLFLWMNHWKLPQAGSLACFFSPTSKVRAKPRGGGRIFGHNSQAACCTWLMGRRWLEKWDGRQGRGRGSGGRSLQATTIASLQAHSGHG